MSKASPRPSSLRVPPHDLDAERAVISACLINKEIIPQIKAIYKPSWMYREAHRHILEAQLTLNKNLDLVTLRDALQRRGQLESCGGDQYLMTLADLRSTSGDWRYWCDILDRHAKRRGIIRQCQETIDQCFQDLCDADEVIAGMKTGIRDIEADVRLDYVDSAELVRQVFADIERRAKSKEKYVGVRTGLDNLDERLCGLEPKTSTYLIARPSMGKTTLALNVADYVAKHHGKVVFFSLESSGLALTRRRMAAKSAVFLSRIRVGDVDDSQWPDLIEAADMLSESNLMIVDRPPMKHIDKLTAFAESLAMRHEISLVVIDHIQLMTCSNTRQSRNDQLGDISAKLQDLAKELSVPVLVLCQLSRQTEMQKDTRPQIHFMRDSGTLEQNADVILGLWRENKRSEYARIECLKGRDVETFYTWLRFDGQLQRFADCTESEVYRKERESRKPDEADRQDYDL